jgi:hypothetical protein
MPSLREFLEQQAQNQDQRERFRRRQEWTTAVSRLIHQLRLWLQEADPNGVLTILPEEAELAEEGLGVYKVPGLHIRLDDRSVYVKPVGRNVLGFVWLPGDTRLRGEGRIDVTDGGRRYILYRSLADGQERWFALNDRHAATPLDQGRFEEIIQELLS